ncbi:uncharacterized protein LOC130804680 [Amaranthus tricolor]|uniref:uncharacterized protein LOC130804680 n=1 Tax=Amaranthus tricolor TaxID=29722 RepID=UPI00258EB42A|nr:uncharacterized protein LOC130804680 [Amaranthus tricolor]
MSSFLKKATKKVTKVAKSLGGSSSSKRKATSTPSVSTTPSISNYNYEHNYPEGYDPELHNYAEEMEREILIDEEEEQEEEPTTPIGINISRQSSTRSHEEQGEQQQQRQARGKRVNFQTIDEDEPVRQPFPAMPPPSGRAVSHVWSYFTKEPTENPDIFLCTCQICESQGVKPLVSYSFTRGGGTGSFNKHLAKKHGITKETHAASGSGTTSGSRQTQWDIPNTGMPFRYNRNDMIDEFSRYVICDELPFNHGESRAYERLTRQQLQPQYRAIPRSTLKRRTIKLYE